MFLAEGGLIAAMEEAAQETRLARGDAVLLGDGVLHLTPLPERCLAFAIEIAPVRCG